MKKAGIYIHIPFCVKKCDYCDFLSFAANDGIKEKYVLSLIEEIKIKSSYYKEYIIDTVFIGGGTPSILSAGYIAKIINQLRKEFTIEKNAEITIEANPGTLDLEKLETYFNNGINRLSIGLQSANDMELKLLGRIHNIKQFEDNYNKAVKVGFKNINIDIMSALPGQDIDSWQDTLHKVLKYEPQHISAYSLIIEETTPFYKKYNEDEIRREKGETTLFLPDEESERNMYETTKKILGDYGYNRYEISNYSKKGFECKHNIRYWERRDYIGLGIGAASLIVNTRYTNRNDINEYLKNKFEYSTTEELTIKQQMEEFMFLGLRMIKGVSKVKFHEIFNLPISQIYGEILIKMINEGLMKFDGLVMYSLTDKGIDISNYVLANMLLE